MLLQVAEVAKPKPETEEQVGAPSVEAIVNPSQVKQDNNFLLNLILKIGFLIGC